jgi:hypothetical protein
MFQHLLLIFLLVVASANGEIASPPSNGTYNQASRRGAGTNKRWVGTLSSNQFYIGTYSGGCVALSDGAGQFIFHRDWEWNALDEDAEKRGFAGLASDPTYAYNTWIALKNSGVEDAQSTTSCGDFSHTHTCGSIKAYLTQPLHTTEHHTKFTTLLTARKFVKFGETQGDPIKSAKMSGSAGAGKIEYFIAILSCIGISLIFL